MHGQQNDKYTEMYGQQNDKYTGMHGQQNDKYTEMYGQQNDKYTEMHGQQNDKYTGMHGQQNVEIVVLIQTVWDRKGHFQEVGILHFHSQMNKMCIYFFDLLVKIYQSYFLNTKHAGVTQR